MIKDKVKIGIQGIDDMLEGGLIPGRPYVLSGTSGSGKTAVAVKFLLEGAEKDELVLYVAIDEPPNEVKKNLSSFGWNMSKIFVFDATPDVLSYDKTPVRDVSTERRVVAFKEIQPSIRKTSEKGPADISINTIQELVKQEMKVRKYTRIVVDSLTSIRRFYIKTSEEYLALQSFYRLLSDLGVTALLIVQLPEVPKSDAESHMSRGEIRLHKWFDGKGLSRGVTIEKLRGSPHDLSMKPMKFSNDGIVVKVAAQKKRAETKKEEESKGKPAKEPPPPAPSVDRAEVAPAPPEPKKQPEPKPEPGPAPEPPLPEPPPPDDTNQAGGARKQ